MRSRLILSRVSAGRPPRAGREKPEFGTLCNKKTHIIKAQETRRDMDFTWCQGSCEVGDLYPDVPVVPKSIPSGTTFRSPESGSVQERNEMDWMFRFVSLPHSPPRRRTSCGFRIHCRAAIASRLLAQKIKQTKPNISPSVFIVSCLCSAYGAGYSNRSTRPVVGRIFDTETLAGGRAFLSLSVRPQ